MARPIRPTVTGIQGTRGTRTGVTRILRRGPIPTGGVTTHVRYTALAVTADGTLGAITGN